MFLLAWCRLFLLVLGVLILPHNVCCDEEAEDGSTENGKDHYERMLIKKETLEFGTSCDPSDRDKITQAETEMHQLDPRSGETESGEMENATDLYIDAIKTFLETGRSLCNRNNLLSCDAATKKCSCGPKEAYGFEFKYVHESNKQCRWAEGSSCLSENDVRERMPHNPGCASNTKCLIVKKNGQNLECNDVNRENEHKNTKKDVDCSCVRSNNNTNANAKASNSASSTMQTSIPLLMLFFFAYANSLHVLLI